MIATKHLAKSHLEQLVLQRQECRNEVQGGIKGQGRILFFSVKNELKRNGRLSEETCEQGNQVAFARLNIFHDI